MTIFPLADSAEPASMCVHSTSVLANEPRSHQGTTHDGEHPDDENTQARPGELAPPGASSVSGENCGSRCGLQHAGLAPAGVRRSSIEHSAPRGRPVTPVVAAEQLRARRGGGHDLRSAGPREHPQGAFGTLRPQWLEPPAEQLQALVLRRRDGARGSSGPPPP